MKKRFIMGLSLLCMIGLCAYIGASSGKNFMKAKQDISENTETENSTASPESMEAAENTELENTDEITEPENLKWNPLVHDKADLWYFYKEDEELIYMHDFISSRDGQGFHWWIYLEATYVMLDYGKRIGYDFMSDHWMVEHIWPIEGGCYNILLSQDNHAVVLDLLCQPEDRKYVIVYAQYENGDHRAGYNDAVSFDSQLEWTDFDYNTPTPEAPSKVIIENPFGDIYETSIYQPCYSALHQYMQDTGYNGKWQIRQVFGRAPFWDYLAESENGFLWICSDLDYFTYVPLPKPDTTGQ